VIDKISSKNVQGHRKSVTEQITLFPLAQAALLSPAAQSALNYFNIDVQCSLMFLTRPEN